MKVKIFGERHTATNALHYFIEQNFGISSSYYDVLGWKHRRAPKKEEWSKVDYKNTLFIFTFRNPYTWLKAMHRQPYYYHQPQLHLQSFEEFIVAPVEDYENTIKMWNEKNDSYLNMACEVPHKLCINMEVFKDSQSIIHRKLKKWLKPIRTFTPFNRYITGSGFKDDNTYDRNNCFPYVSDEVYSIINANLNKSLVEELHYDIVNRYTELAGKK